MKTTAKFVQQVVPGDTLVVTGYRDDIEVKVLNAIPVGPDTRFDYVVIWHDQLDSQAAD